MVPPWTPLLHTRAGSDTRVGSRRAKPGSAHGHRLPIGHAWAIVRNLDRDDLPLEAPFVDGRDRPAVRLVGIRVERIAERFHSSASTSAEMPCGTISQRSWSFSENEKPSGPRFEPMNAGHVLHTRGDDHIEVSCLRRWR